MAIFKSIEITKDTYYVGVNDRTKVLFENLWPLPKGVSYNSYIIKDEKVALFDTVDICYADIFFSRLESALQGRTIDYLIVNHMEPDHSGSIELLTNRYPGVKIIGNARTADMLKGFYDITDNVEIVKDGQELVLGEHTLQFHLTPLVHWPETMMTVDTTTKTLFAGDAFGTFGSLDGGVLDTQLYPEDYWDEMVRYYSNIVGKYGAHVQKALKKLAGVELDNICSTHGPVWTQKENIAHVVNLYDKLSKYEADNGVVIVYGSMYGHVEQTAELIAAELAEQGIRRIVMHNVSKSHPSFIIRDIFKYKGLIIGSPTYNNELYPLVDTVVSAIENRQMKSRYLGYFGGFTWASAAVKKLAEFAEKTKFEVVGESVDIKQSMKNETAETALLLARAMAEKLKSLED